MKTKIAVIYGGLSSEHDVSIMTKESVCQNLNTEKYTIETIYITKGGEWLLDSNKATVVNESFLRQFDTLFPVLHGPNGEDGKVQGYFETLGIPYVGCGVLSSAIGMDKEISKFIFMQKGLPTCPFISMRKWQVDSLQKAKDFIAKHAFPFFVKPANLGSSIGVSKVDQMSDLEDAIAHAFKFDPKILIEKGVLKAREIEFAVLGNQKPKVSIAGEISCTSNFYDYEAKYSEGKSQLIIPASLDEKLSSEMQRVALVAYQSLECRGLARVDFLLDPNTSDFYINEINTMPGFTTQSMFPKLWQASGVSYQDLLDELINLALEKKNED